MFTVEERDRVRERVLALARDDPRVVAGAVVGSLADGGGDRWSDLDLTFAVADGTAVGDVLADWTRRIVEELDGVHLFDLSSGATIYRVFLLPGTLQLDVSFTPAAAFGAGGSKWRLLFGTAVERPPAAPPSAAELFGYAVHHARAARVAIERGRRWQAEYWISSLRDYGLALACRRLGLPASYGRGFDDLPAEVLAGFESAIVRSLERGELLRTLACAVESLLSETAEVEELAAKVKPQLRELASA
ncbi:MAG: hypothetical protein WD249_13430 [Gaiellaceae bacterium]